MSRLRHQSVERSVEFPGPASPGRRCRRCAAAVGTRAIWSPPTGSIWRTSLMPSGPVTARITRSAPDTVDCEAWGSGAAEFADTLPALLGADDDATGFAPEEPTIAAAHRRAPHLRLGRTGRVLEALIPAVIEQRVAGEDAFRAWRLLVTKFGAPAPGPAPARMRVPPPADVWRRIPSWEFHRANVDPGRARTIVGCAQRADSLERLADAAGGTGPRGADVAARRRGVDGRRDGAARVRRCRCAVDRRLSPGQSDRLDACSAIRSTTTRWSNCSSRCARTATGRCGCSRSAGWPATRGSGRGGRSRICARFSVLRRDYRPACAGTRSGQSTCEGAI